MNFREGQTFDVAVIPMASATATTSFNLNPVGEGYKKTARGDERELLSEGELFDAQEINVHILSVSFCMCRLSRFFFGIVRILLKMDCLELPFFDILREIWINKLRKYFRLMLLVN